MVCGVVLCKNVLYVILPKAAARLPSKKSEQIR